MLEQTTPLLPAFTQCHLSPNWYNELRTCRSRGSPDNPGEPKKLGDVLSNGLGPHLESNNSLEVWRLERRQWPEQPRPMFLARNIQHEMAERVRAIDCGGIGAFHTLARTTGLIPAIAACLHLLKRHLPYHESDHVLNIGYTTLTGGTCLEDIELRRNGETYMDALGAQRIPDPTTAGDFTRRVSDPDVRALLEAINGIRPKVWKKRLSGVERREAIPDVDGTVAPTTDDCKEGMGLTYNGVWKYRPLVISLANTLEPLYVVDRPGNRPSHEREDVANTTRSSNNLRLLAAIRAAVRCTLCRRHWRTTLDLGLEWSPLSQINNHIMYRSAASYAGRLHCLVGRLLMVDENEFVCIKAKRCRFLYKGLLQFIAYFRTSSQNPQVRFVRTTHE